MILSWWCESAFNSEAFDKTQIAGKTQIAVVVEGGSDEGH